MCVCVGGGGGGGGGVRISRSELHDPKFCQIVGAGSKGVSTSRIMSSGKAYTCPQIIDCSQPLDGTWKSGP